jgi:NAD(P)-dependent dehydrogenase (short-subunit alcohol dehydrogenase family)
VLQDLHHAHRLIVGASRGLGLEFVRQYHRAGWQVLAACRDPATASALTEFAVQSPGIEVVACDVTDSDSVASLAQAMSGRAVDHLIFNAGISARATTRRPISTSRPGSRCCAPTPSPAPLRRQLRRSRPKQREEAHGVHLQPTRQHGENTWGGHYIYGSSKAALNCVVKSLAIELRPQGITCVVLTPGW